MTLTALPDLLMMENQIVGGQSWEDTYYQGHVMDLAKQIAKGYGRKSVTKDDLSLAMKLYSKIFYVG